MSISERDLHYYKVKGKFIEGEKWLDKKGILWTIDEITDNFILIESDIEERHVLKKIDFEHSNDYLNFKLC